MFEIKESDLKLGIAGVQQALKVLNDYYSGAGARSDSAVSSKARIPELADPDRAPAPL
jgi:hypothetical protein